MGHVYPAGLWIASRTQYVFIPAPTTRKELELKGDGSEHPRLTQEGNPGGLGRSSELRVSIT